MYISSLNTLLIESNSGAKAFHLSKMKRANFPIPDGFVIHLNAFEDFFKTNTAINNTLLHELSESLKAIGANKYMVRSSAIGEDSAETSFAGQLSSFISTSDIDDIAQHIQKCWSSYEKENVKVYEQKSGKTLKGMGVVIQELIEPDHAGVLFTRNPSNENEMLLEYVAGHGEKLVSGEVNPHSFVYSRINKPTNNNLPFQFTQLQKSAEALELFYGFPLDIEWVIKNGKLQIVQARPITTSSKSKSVYWSNTNVNENYPDAISPLLYSIARESYYHYFKNLSILFSIPKDRIKEMESSYSNVIGVWGCKMYYNMTSIHEVISASPFSEMLLKSFNNFVGYSAEKKKEKPDEKGSRFKFLTEVLKFNSKLNTTVVEFETTAEQYSSKVNSAITFNELRDCFHSFIEIRMHSWYKASLADFFAMLYHGVLGKFCSKFYDSNAEGMHNKLIQAIPGLISSTPIILIYQIRIALKQDAIAYQKFKNSTPIEFYEWLKQTSVHENCKKRIEYYIENWGYRCSGELMLTSKTYCEEPEKFIELLQQYDLLPESDPKKLIALKYKERNLAIREFKKRILKKNGLLFHKALVQLFVLTKLVNLASKGVSARERVRLKQALLYFKFKQVIERTGQEFHKRNIIDDPNDIFYLRYQEIAEIFSSSDMLSGNVKERILVNKEEFSKNKNLIYPDDFISHIGEYPLPENVITKISTNSKDSNLIKGLSACGGKIKGRAKVLSSVLEANKLEKGDILVTRQTDPGWVLVFPLISGLIVERGGMLSHGAIVSREFGIPAIVGVENATIKIKDGDLIYLNADSGEITFCNE